MRGRRIWYVGVILCGIWGSCASLAWGQTTVLVDFSSTREPVPQGWELTVNKGEPQLQLVQDDGKQALRMRSGQASFSLQKKIHIALQASPLLVWDWKVTELPGRGFPSFGQRRPGRAAHHRLFVESFSVVYMG